MTAALQIESLTYRYPKAERDALDAVSFSVEAGSRFALLGPNGCGKTTLFRILATLLPPQQGDVRVFDADLKTQPHQVRSLLGVVFQHPSLDGELTTLENLTHHGHLYNLRGQTLQTRIDEAVEQFDLGELRDQRTGKLSGGQQRRIEIAKALLHHPRVLLMDEPSTGLDPAVRHNLWNLLDTIQKQRELTIALTTHLLDEADRCTRVAILDQGKRVALDAPENLKSQLGGDVIVLQTRPQAVAKLTDAIQSNGGPSVTHTDAGTLRFESTQGPKVIADLSEQFGEDLQRITLGPPTLDDVFLNLTGRELNPHAET